MEALIDFPDENFLMQMSPHKKHFTEEKLSRTHCIKTFQIYFGNINKKRHLIMFGV